MPPTTGTCVPTGSTASDADILSGASRRLRPSDGITTATIPCDEGEATGAAEATGVAVGAGWNKVDVRAGGDCANSVLPSPIASAAETTTAPNRRHRPCAGSSINDPLCSFPQCYGPS